MHGFCHNNENFYCLCPIPQTQTHPLKITHTDPNFLVNRLMTEGSDKETRHFELSLKDSGLNYLPGDSLGVVPTNCEEVVGDLLNAVGLSGEETIRIGEESVILKYALMNRLACTVLSKIQIKKFNEIAQTEQLTDLLQIANKDSLVDYMWGRELIDLFLEFPQQGISAQEFVDLLRPMPPQIIFDCFQLICPYRGGSSYRGCSTL